jgi:hypothetical protein
MVMVSLPYIVMIPPCYSLINILYSLIQGSWGTVQVTSKLDGYGITSLYSDEGLREVFI